MQRDCRWNVKPWQCVIDSACLVWWWRAKHISQKCGDLVTVHIIFILHSVDGLHPVSPLVFQIPVCCIYTVFNIPVSLIIPPLQAWDSLCRRSGSSRQQWDLWSRCGLRCQDWRYGQVKMVYWFDVLGAKHSFISLFFWLSEKLKYLSEPVLFSVHFPGTAWHWTLWLCDCAAVYWFCIEKVQLCAFPEKLQCFSFRRISVHSSV